MNIKIIINSQLSTIESEKQIKQIRRTETESWESFGALSIWRGKVGLWGKVAGTKKYKLVGTE